MKLILLGTGTPNAEPWAGFPAYAVIHQGKSYLFECGAGIVRACTAMFCQGIEELSPACLKNVFITHLHSDHTAGLAEIILIPWVLERREPLHIYGPAGIDRMCSHILRAYEADTGFRTGGPEPLEAGTLDVRPHMIGEGTVFEQDGVRITAVRASHGMEAYSYVFEADAKKIVLSGDTAPLASMKKTAQNADILVHEAEYSAALSERTPAWQNYHRSIHTMSYDLADIMNAAKPKLTVTTHRILHLDYYGNGPVAMDEVQRREAALLQEIRSRSDMPAVNGHDGDIFEI